MRQITLLLDGMTHAPDGISQVDAEGAIWVADFTRTRVLRVAPGGKILEEIQTADRNGYACALGGADGRTLFLCVTPAEFNPDVRRANPLSAVRSTRVDIPLACGAMSFHTEVS